MLVQFLGWQGPLEEGMTIHSSILAWRIPWTEKPCRLQSMGSRRVGHNWSNLEHMHAVTYLAVGGLLHLKWFSKVSWIICANVPLITGMDNPDSRDRKMDSRIFREGAALLVHGWRGGKNCVLYTFCVGILCLYQVCLLWKCCYGSV